jgi:phenylacetic acid degradation operon negative regulatory protein
MSAFRNAPVPTSAPGHALTARSVLLSVLLGTDPPRLPVALLVSTTELFGINEGTTRTALSRMAAKGEVRADDGHYELASPRLLQRQHRQDRSRVGMTQPWQPGDPWVQAVVATSGARPAAARAELRRSLLDARLAEWRDGVWIRPANLDRMAAVHDDSLVWGVVQLDADPQLLAASLWALDEWSDVASHLVDDMEALVPGLESSDHAVLAPGFVVSAAVLRQLQADPLLPSALLAADWPGVALRDAYGRFDTAYRGVLRDWFDAHRV